MEEVKGEIKKGDDPSDSMTTIESVERNEDVVLGKVGF